MKKYEKLEYLKDADFGLFVKTRQMVFDELSEQQTMFCCSESLQQEHMRVDVLNSITEYLKKLSNV